MLKKNLALAVATVVTFLSTSAWAQGAAAAANDWDAKSWAAIGAGIAIGLAVLGGAMGQGRAIASAVEGISRNPGAGSKVQTAMIIGLALIESLVLFAFAIAFLLQSKVTFGG